MIADSESPGCDRAPHGQTGFVPPVCGIGSAPYEEYNTHAAFKKIPLDALKKLPSPMNLICVTPTRIDALFSDFKKDGYSVRQVLHQLT